MAEDHSWMYSGWDKEENYTDEQMHKATSFLDCAFSRSKILRCPCSRCQNLRCLDDKLPYTCVRMVSCQAMTCGHFTVSQILES
jgi:hypothetical protein